MTQPSKGCREDLITALVQGSLEETLEARVSDHLNECVRCREALDAATESSRLWQDIRQTMTEQPYDQASGLLSKEQIAEAIGHWKHEEQSLGDKPVLAPSIQHVLQSLAPTDNPNMLGRLGHHEVRGVIGAGGMGVVLKAFDPSLDRMVAIKILAPHLATSGAARQRFAREAKAAAAVLHPNVVAIHGVSDGGESGLPYLVMPYVRGITLQARIDRDGSLSLTEILQVAVQVADGLAAAHDQGLVHRDIKPANIILEDGVERVSIMDFGLARTVDDATLTQSGVIAGTPQYMSPEQARGDSVDARSDLFSLGSLLYVMSVGHPPFRAETAYGILRRITDEAARPVREVRPDLPDWLEVLVERLHAKSASERFSSAAEVADVLRACLAHVQSATSALPDALIPVGTQTWKLRFLSGGILLAMLFAGAVAGTTIFFPGNDDGSQSRTNSKSSRLATDVGHSAESVDRRDSNSTSDTNEITAVEAQQLIDSFSWQASHDIAQLDQQLNELEEGSKVPFQISDAP